jgi:hypothetical protein
VAALLAATSASVFTSACGDPPVTLSLVAADDLTVPPEFIRLVFRPKDAEPVETEIFTRLALPENAFVEVQPGVVFSVDVIGCTDNTRETCESEETFNARGCTGGLVRGREDTLAITVELHGAVQGNALCPVEAPET